MSPTAYLGLGANIGQPVQQLHMACQHLSQHGVAVVQQSALYSSPAWGKTDQPDFVNQVLAVRWAGSPEGLMHTLLAIEQLMGRVRSTQWGPRTIDIDILSLGNVQLDTPSLQLPHPHLAQRAFVLVPWASIAAQYVVPGLGRSVGQLLAALPAAEVAAITVLR